jgi:hypothetical protein
MGNLEFYHCITARFQQKETGEPLSGHQYMARLYDQDTLQDTLQDDFLGESLLNQNGEIEIRFLPQQIASLDSPFEKFPDLYLVLLKGQEVLLKTQVIEDLDMNREGKLGQGLYFNMGVFLV